MDSPVTAASPQPYRLPAATRPGLVRLQVSDLERSVEWYTRVLGLRVADGHPPDGQHSVGRHSDGRHSDGCDGGAILTDRAGGAPLVELRERAGAGRARRRLGLYHVALLLPERAALGALLRHLALHGEHVGAADHLVSEALYLSDPDGLGLELYADRPREGWRVSDGEIAMDTRPLDAHDLARAARTTVWDGMPAGTTVGHVHLHVGDLQRADAFYHGALGLDRVVWSYPGALFLSAGGYHHHLGLNTWAGDAEPAHDDEARLLDWSLVLPTPADVRDAADRLRAGGFPAQGDVAEDVLITADAWGTTLRILHEG